MFIIEKLEIWMNNKNDRISPGYKHSGMNSSGSFSVHKLFDVLKQKQNHTI